jgi:hypothetical protein
MASEDEIGVAGCWKSGSNLTEIRQSAQNERRIDMQVKADHDERDRNASPETNLAIVAKLMWDKDCGFCLASALIGRPRSRPHDGGVSARSGR